jgi:hypothetical protein
VARGISLGAQHGEIYSEHGGIIETIAPCSEPNVKITACDPCLLLATEIRSFAAKLRSGAAFPLLVVRLSLPSMA